MFATNVQGMSRIGPSPTNTFEVLLHEIPRIAPSSAGMVATVTIPPGDPGSGPHRHSGPVFGYVLEGEILFELEGEGRTRSRPARRSGSRVSRSCTTRRRTCATDIASKFVVFMLCAPDVPMMTYLDEAEVDERAHLRWSDARR